MSIYGRGVTLGGGSTQTLPPQIKNFEASSVEGRVYLSWSLPDDTQNYKGMIITRKLLEIPKTVNDGEKLTVGAQSTAYTDTELENGNKYYYRAFPFNGRRQFQTDITGAVVEGAPTGFHIPKFTGSHAVVGNERQGSIELYSSGNVLLARGVYDVFAVGGGGAGGDPGGFFGGSMGGSGGYTVTRLGWNVEYNEYFEVQIGTGAPGAELGQSAGSSHLRSEGGEDVIVAQGATGAVMAEGEISVSSSGGSGGGIGEKSRIRGYGYGGYGGSDGSDGQDHPDVEFVPIEAGHGQGQGGTTRAFGEPGGTLYAGGGAAGVCTTEPGTLPPADAIGIGGAGGGGNGGYYSADATTYAGENGTPNTGGGGGGGQKYLQNDISTCGDGGSGIVIIRWNRESE